MASSEEKITQIYDYKYLYFAIKKMKECSQDLENNHQGITKYLDDINSNWVSAKASNLPTYRLNQEIDYDEQLYKNIELVLMVMLKKIYHFEDTDATLEEMLSKLASKYNFSTSDENLFNYFFNHNVRIDKEHPIKLGDYELVPGRNVITFGGITYDVYIPQNYKGGGAIYTLLGGSSKIQKKSGYTGLFSANMIKRLNDGSSYGILIAPRANSNEACRPNGNVSRWNSKENNNGNYDALLKALGNSCKTSVSVLLGGSEGAKAVMEKSSRANYDYYIAASGSAVGLTYDKTSNKNKYTEIKDNLKKDGAKLYFGVGRSDDKFGYSASYRNKIYQVETDVKGLLGKDVKLNKRGTGNKAYSNKDGSITYFEVDGGHNDETFNKIVNLACNDINNDLLSQIQSGSLE